MVQVSATSSCTTKGHPVVHSSEKELNFEGNIVAPLYGCHFCLLLTNESWDSIRIVSLVYWNEVPQVRLTSFVDSYWLS